MKKVLTYFSILSAVAVLSLSCTKESIKTMYTTQEGWIESFITNVTSSDEDAYVVGNKGSQRVVVTEGEGEAVNGKGTISFYYAGYVLKSSTVSASNLFATNNEDIATQASWSTSSEDQFDVLTINLSEADLVEGLKNGLEGVKGGEECYILFSGKYGYGKRPLGTIPANAALVYHIWVESTSND
jgi:FKBP-type peptidyl-prolyl cis-trans isomerase